MTTTLDRLLEGLPVYFDREPHPVPALTIQRVGGGEIYVTIAQSHLSVRPTGGSIAAPMTYDLEDYTLASLATALSSHAGTYATVITPADATVGAAALLDVTEQALGNNIRFNRSTTLLWSFLRPLDWHVTETRLNEENGARMMSVKTAEGLWVDLWGVQYYGNVARKKDEDDRTYAERIMREVTRWRLNNYAIQEILQEDLGVTSTVTNLHDLAWVIAKTKYGFLAGRKYSRTTFMVTIDKVTPEIAYLIERNRAAGTLAYFSYREIPPGFALTGPPLVEAYETLGDRDEIVDAITYEWHDQITTRRVDDVLQAGAQPSFVLGQSILGQVFLGQGSSFAYRIQFTDGVGWAKI